MWANLNIRLVHPCLPVQKVLVLFGQLGLVLPHLNWQICLLWSIIFVMRQQEEWSNQLRLQLALGTVHFLGLGIVTAEKSLSHRIETVILTESFLLQGKSPTANKPTWILRPVSRLLSAEPGSPSWATTESAPTVSKQEASKAARTLHRSGLCNPRLTRTRISKYWHRLLLCCHTLHSLMLRFF